MLALMQRWPSAPRCPARDKRAAKRGFTLIEFMVVMVLMGILLALGIPSFMNWLQSAQIRTAAESIMNGLQMARNEAVNRNVAVGFYLTSDLTSTCTQSLAGTSWVVSLNDPTNPPACNSPASDVTTPFVIQHYTSAEGARNVVVTATTNASVTFNGLGVASNSMAINVSNPSGGACAQAGGLGGPMHCLNVNVSSAGQVSMCDPALSGQTPPDPQGC